MMVVSKTVKFSLILLLFSFQSIFAQDLKAPTIKEYKASHTNVDLVWSDQNYHGIKYKVYRSNDGSSGWSQIGTVDYKWTPYYSDNIGYSTKRYYRVVAYDPSTGVTSGYSNVVNTTTPSAPNGTVYYVDAVNGNDNNSGTSESKAWRSLNKVNSSSKLFKPGVRVLFKRSQTWTGNLFIKGGGGTSSNPVIFDTYGSGSKPIINAGNSYAIYCERSYYTFRNLHVRNNNIEGITSSGGSQNGIFIEHCRVENTNPSTKFIKGICLSASEPNGNMRAAWNEISGYSVGAQISRGYNQKLEFNYIYDTYTGEDGIIAGSQNRSLQGSLIRYNHLTKWGEDAIDFFYGRDLIVEYNYIHNPLKTVVGGQAQGNGIKMGGSGSAGNCIVRYNIIHSLDQPGGLNDGIYQQDNNMKAYGNILWNINGDGIVIRKSNCDTYNNTIIINPSSPLKTGRGIIITGSPSGIRIQNNIISGKSSSYDIDVNNVSVTGGYNLLVNDASVGNSRNYSGSSNDYRNTDPKFVNVSKYDFRLKDGSPCINSGTYIVDLLFDVLGIQISTNSKPSRGAIQYSTSVTNIDNNPPSLQKLNVISVNTSSYTIEPSKTIDGKKYDSGDNNSRWIAYQSQNQWVNYDLGSIKSLKDIKISFYGFNTNIKHVYTIAVKENWYHPWVHIVNSSTSQSTEWTTNSFSNLKARYIKILINSVQNASTPSIWEVEFWGESSLGKESAAEENNEITVETPEQFELAQNYPNPFNPSTSIKYSLPVESHVKLTIYNTLGEVVTELVNNTMNMGYHEVNWNASGLASGMYIYSLDINPLDGSAGFKAVKKMSLVK